MTKSIKSSVIVAIVVCFSMFYISSCTKKNSLSVQPLQTSFKTTVIHGSLNIDIRVSAVTDEPNKIVRKIEYLNRKTNAVIATYFNEVISSDLPILEAIKNNNKFNGTMNIINSSGFRLVSQTIKENKIVYSHLEVLPKVLVEELGGDPCSLSGIHDCVAGRINDMGFVEYVICLATAPECYATQWIICGARC